MMRSIAVVLLVVGITAVVYGLVWHKETVAEAKLGPVELEVEERRRPNLPIWGGLAGIGVGAGLLYFGTRRQ